MIKTKKIKNLNLFTIKFPLPALVSILHRMSGVFLFLLMPVITISLWYSLISEHYFFEVINFFKWWPMKFMLLILIFILLQLKFVSMERGRRRSLRKLL